MQAKTMKDETIFQKVKRVLRMKNKLWTAHVEAIFDDEVWEEIKKEVRKGKIKKWYVMTPANYDYFVGMFHIKLTRAQLANKMARRYKWMLDHGQQLELHLHLNRLANLSYEEQKKLLEQSFYFFKKGLGIKPNEIVFGWWLSNQDSNDLIKKYNLKKITEEDYNAIHDYNFVDRKYSWKRKKRR